jgi:hypothetical protein
MAFIIVTQLVYARTRHDLLANYNAALLSICFMVLLGAWLRRREMCGRRRGVPRR